MENRKMLEKELEQFLEKVINGQEEFLWGLELIQKAAEENIDEGKRQLGWYYVEYWAEDEEKQRMAARLFYEVDDRDGLRSIPRRLRSEILKELADKENLF